MDPRQIAATNLAAVALNRNLGFSVICGLDTTGENLVLVCLKTSPEEEGRNCRFGVDESTGRVFIEPVNLLGITGPAIPRVYNVMNSLRHAGVEYHVGGSGNNVDTVLGWYGKDQGLDASLRRISWKHDAPSLIASCRWAHDEPIIKMSRVEKSPFRDAPDPHLYVPDIGPGFGYCLTECFGNGDTRSPFLGDPFLLPLDGSARSVMHSLWEVLDTEYKVAIVVKFIPRNGARPEIVLHDTHMPV